jgi:hypothetical protein
MTTTTIEKSVHFRRQAHGRLDLQERKEAGCQEPGPARIPRVSRLMALALRFEQLLLDGTIRHQAELARLGQVSRARVSQILALVHLAPDLQEELLFLQSGHRGADLLLADLRPIAALTDWAAQRRHWRALRRHFADGSRQALTARAT